ncbi:MAG: helix-turn-helix transcriptional regulator [Hyphomicrobiales bacterium]|nr:helix-turn-helix transcriptional regulator [Hyphomicrobiales bacterium]
MITNERQYKITCAQADRFQHALDEFDTHPREDVHPLLIKAERDALESQLADLRAEIDEYEHLKSANASIISAISFDELADSLIKARIAVGISQKELAERLDLKEQQIQRYESERYNSASYQRIRDIANALGVRIRNDILMPVTPVGFEGVLRKLYQVGLDKDFLFSRLFPSTDIIHFLDELTKKESETLITFTKILNQVFGWTDADLFAPTPLAPPRSAVAEARFKMPARRTRSHTSLYAAYANYLAVVVLKASRDLPQCIIPTDAGKMRKNLIDQYGDLTLNAALQYSWDLGVPVLPLRERSAFHGACWRYEKRNVIILKQSSKYESRWLFDLLHEMFHAAQQPEADTMEIIEADETSAERRNSDEEIAASQFAGDVLLDGRAEDLAKACVQAAKGSVEQLKKAVPDVAKHEKVGIGALANYMAFRLSWQNINWWGVAANLQDEDNDPWRTTCDVFKKRFSFSFENDIDRDLLARALD